MMLATIQTGIALWMNREPIKDAVQGTLEAFRRTDPRPRHWDSWREFESGGEMRFWRWSNFHPQELSCNCQGRFCDGAYFHDPDFLDRLQRVRDLMGHPIRLNSVHRCPLWNAVAGGAPRSRHKRIAADISLHGIDLAKLYQAVRSVDFTGLGFAASFLHVDVRERPAAWGYGPVGESVWAPIGIDFDPASGGRRILSIPRKDQSVDGSSH